MKSSNRFDKSKNTLEYENIANKWIKSTQVRLLKEDGGSEIIDTKTAMDLAQQQGLDLITVSKDASPPVCRIYDLGKYAYEQKKIKKEQERKNRENAIVIKEIQLRPGIGDHDLLVKQRRANEFLGEGNKVKIVVKFRGRENAHTGMGFDLLTRFTTGLIEHRCEKDPMLSGNTITTMLAQFKN
jgi:translation initiation factor IF-3